MLEIKRPSIPIAHSAQLKESCNNIEIWLNAIHYSDYHWNLYGDLKIIGMLMGLQGGLPNTIVYGRVVPLYSTMKQKNGRQEIHLQKNEKYSTHSFSKFR